MAPDPLSPSANPDEEELDEEEEEENGDRHVAADADGETETNSDEDEEEDESSDKTGSPVRGLDHGSDADSDKTVPSPSAFDFVVKENSESKKKRAAETELVNEKSESKKSKKKGEKENAVAVDGGGVEDNVVPEDKAKRPVGQRIWGPEDELMIVKGMMDYKEKTGVDFNSNLDSFYQFIKGQLNAFVDKSQLINKIRKLKQKFRDNAAKEANGELVFLKSHESEVYECSKKVWGGKVVARSKSKSKKEKEVVVVPQSVMEVDNVLALPVPDLEVSKKEVNGGSAKSASRVHKAKVVQKTEHMEDDVEMKNSVIPMPVMVGNSMLEKGLELVEKSKLVALNKKWSKYQIDAAELYVRRLDLIKQQTELILDALKSNP